MLNGAPFPTYELTASEPYARGVQHGEQAREQIAVSIQTYKRLFRDFVGIDWEAAKRLGSKYASPIAAFDEELLAEIQGIAAGSGFEFEEILALNARSEIALTSALVDGCTAFAAFGRATRDGQTLLCQNWDWRSSQRDAFVILLIERPGKPAVTTLTEAGIVGKLGFNDRGLGVCLNAIVTDDVRGDGTPLHVVIRGILESRNLGEAVEVVSRANTASAANFLVAQHGVGAVDIEVAPSDFDVLLPDDCLLVHTNHLLSPRLIGVRDLGKYVLPDSYPRLARARYLLAEYVGHIDEAIARQVLRDHANEPDSICRHEDPVGDPEGKRLQSVFSLVMNLGEGVFSVTDGPPCSHDFASLKPTITSAGATR